MFCPPNPKSETIAHSCRKTCALLSVCRKKNKSLLDLRQYQAGTICSSERRLSYIQQNPRPKTSPRCIQREDRAVTCMCGGRLLSQIDMLPLWRLQSNRHLNTEHTCLRGSASQVGAFNRASGPKRGESATTRQVRTAWKLKTKITVNTLVKSKHVHNQKYTKSLRMVPLLSDLTPVGPMWRYGRRRQNRVIILMSQNGLQSEQQSRSPLWWDIHARKDKVLHDTPSRELHSQKNVFVPSKTLLVKRPHTSKHFSSKIMRYPQFTNMKEWH